MVELGKWEDLAKGPYDLVIADPPYGITQCDWDKAPQVDRMWADLKPLVSERAVIVFTSFQPFTSALVASAPTGWLRYPLVWEKPGGKGHLNANKRPLSCHEDVLVFSPAKLGRHTYHPQFTPGAHYVTQGTSVAKAAYGAHGPTRTPNKGTRHPRSVLRFGQGRGWHPTRKPLDLMRWLIKTYTNKGDRVLEPYGGSCPVLKSCLELGRECDSFEISEEYVSKVREELAA